MHRRQKKNASPDQNTASAATSAPTTESTGAGIIIIAIAGSRVLYAQRIESTASGHGESAR